MRAPALALLPSVMLAAVRWSWVKCSHRNRQSFRTRQSPRTCSSTTGDAKKRILSLRKLLKQYSKAYYVEAKPLVSDEEYDKLFAELMSLETAHPKFVSRTSPTQVVGSSLRKGKNGETLVTHSTPMLSLANAFSIDELKAFDSRIRRMSDIEQPTYVVEFKYDGIALALHYENGKFVRALTRGDGRMGEDVTSAIRRYVPSVAHDLKEWERFGSHIEIRGEVFLTKDAFQQFNQDQEEARVFTNARNLASGLLKRKLDAEEDSKKAPAAFLTFVGYNLLCDHAPRTHWALVEAVSALGIPTGSPFIRLITSIDEFVDLERKWSEQRTNLPFEVDGMVLKLNDRDKYDRLGFTSHSPRFAIAWKFSAKQATTRIKSVALSVGRTGKVTPVATVEPVHLSGIHISRATLHNRDYMDKNRIVPGCRVIIERSGDVIPKIVGRAGDISDVPLADLDTTLDWSVCPCDLKYPLIKTGNVDYSCTNPVCPPQRLRQLEHFCEALEIEGLGPSTLKQLVELGYIADITDIFSLKEQNLTKLRTRDGWGDKKISNILDQITHAVSRTTLATLIFALGIPHVGKETAQTLANRVDTLSQLMTYNEESLAKLDEIGPVVARSIASYCAHSDAKARIQALESIGVGSHANRSGDASETSQRENGNIAQSMRLDGITLVFTGALSSMSRKEAEHLVKQHGGKVKSSITKGTTYLVEGTAPSTSMKTTSSKLATARSMGLRILSEQEFFELLK